LYIYLLLNQINSYILGDSAFPELPGNRILHCLKKDTLRRILDPLRRLQLTRIHNCCTSVRFTLNQLAFHDIFWL
jgi:hypothetical protein